MVVQAFYPTISSYFYFYFVRVRNITLKGARAEGFDKGGGVRELLGGIDGVVQ